MAQNWLVTFRDKRKLGIVTVQVNCYEAHAAAEIAFEQLEKTDALMAEKVRRGTYSVLVEDA